MSETSGNLKAEILQLRLRRESAETGPAKAAAEQSMASLVLDRISKGVDTRDAGLLAPLVDGMCNLAAWGSKDATLKAVTRLDHPPTTQKVFACAIGVHERSPGTVQAFLDHHLIPQRDLERMLLRTARMGRLDVTRMIAGAIEDKSVLSCMADSPGLHKQPAAAEILRASGLRPSGGSGNPLNLVIGPLPAPHSHTHRP